MRERRVAAFPSAAAGVRPAGRLRQASRRTLRGGRVAPGRRRDVEERRVGPSSGGMAVELGAGSASPPAMTDLSPPMPRRGRVRTSRPAPAGWGLGAVRGGAPVSTAGVRRGAVRPSHRGDPSPPASGAAGDRRGPRGASDRPEGGRAGPTDGRRRPRCVCPGRAGRREAGRAAGPPAAARRRRAIRRSAAGVPTARPGTAGRRHVGSSSRPRTGGVGLLRSRRPASIRAAARRGGTGVPRARPPRATGVREVAGRPRTPRPIRRPGHPSGTGMAGRTAGRSAAMQPPAAPRCAPSADGARPRQGSEGLARFPGGPAHGVRAAGPLRTPRFGRPAAAARGRRDPCVRPARATRGLGPVAGAS